jgi:hypothetical protein
MVVSVPAFRDLTIRNGAREQVLDGEIAHTRDATD